MFLRTKAGEKIMNIAVITGASSGIGKVMAESLHNYFDGIDEIWAIARSEDKLKSLETKIPVRVIKLDLTKDECLKEYSRLLEQENPNVKILINSAGYGKFGKPCEISTEATLGMIDLNCKALVSVTSSSLPYMQKNARILQICSVASFIPLPFINVYGATKSFVQSYSLALSEELKPYKISVTTLCPFWTNTEFFAVAEDVNSNTKAVKNYMGMLPPEKVAHVGLKALKNKKAFAIPGFLGKVLLVLSKVAPKRLAMKVWLLNCNK